MANNEHTDRGCLVEHCTRPHRARGLCQTHWRRWRHHGHLGLLIGQEPSDGPACLDCGKPVPIKSGRASKFCTDYHRNRWARRQQREITAAHQASDGC
ncbi:hypothetical protein GA0070609_4428 [Micromonospora echinaurantiaca]|uniref:Uncharacterized protein n=1 Tax=Micromonospora echinaurantiaca TaxID=47857 RepID=A0A1C5JH14_9ACTN|nr:hypothetical protein GA0070609_4428 [Micromonospora echinaurantiaca]